MVTQISCEDAVFAGKLLVSPEIVEVLCGCLGPLKGCPPDIGVTTAGDTRSAELRGRQCDAGGCTGRRMRVETQKSLDIRIRRRRRCGCPCSKVDNRPAANRIGNRDAIGYRYASGPPHAFIVP